MDATPTGLLYVREFLTGREQATCILALQSLQYTRDFFRGRRLKRGYAQFGYAYVSTGRKLEMATAMPEFLRAVIKKAKAHCCDDVDFNQCIVTYYPPGSGIGWHTDSRRFGDCIIGVSLGGEARLQFRPNQADKPSFEIQLATGSMYLMRGAARWQYQHQVLPVKSDRYSLTFRHVANECDATQP